MLQTRQNRNVTIQRVASRAGVSRMTVYRALKGTGEVRQETVLRIKEAFKEGRQLTETPALLKSKVAVHCSRRFFEGGIETTEGNYYSNLINSILRSFQLENIECFQLDCAKLNEKEEECLRQCSLIMVCGPFSNDAYKKMTSLNSEIKILSILGWDYLEGAYYVRGNDFAGGANAADVMLKYGHRHTAVLGTLNAFDRMIRYSAFFSVMNQNGATVKLIECDPELAFEQKTGKFDELLAESPRVTAVFVLCGVNAVTLRNYLSEKGLNVPEDIGIVTFDNLKIYDVFGMNFTKVYFELDDIAFTAVKTTLNILNSDMLDGSQVLVPVKMEDGFSVTNINNTAIRVEK